MSEVTVLRAVSSTRAGNACGGCRYFRRVVARGAGGQTTAQKTGLCRAHGPGVDERGRGVWPLVEETDDCGEYDAASTLFPEGLTELSAEVGTAVVEGILAGAGEEGAKARFFAFDGDEALAGRAARHAAHLAFMVAPGLRRVR